MRFSAGAFADQKLIKEAYPPTKGATHFQFINPGRKPLILPISELFSLAGCAGNLEYGVALFEGEGRNRKIVGFSTHIPRPKKAKRRSSFQMLQEVRAAYAKLSAEADVLRAEVTGYLEACDFLRVEGPFLGLAAGDNIISKGVPALKKQRDVLAQRVRDLHEQLKKGRNK